MKKLILIRHGDNKMIDNNDFNRQLTSKGIFNSIVMGIKLKELEIQPDRIYVSEDPRCVETANQMLVTAGIGMDKVRLRPELYQAKPQILVDLIESVVDTVNTIMVFGHHPTLVGVANMINSVFVEKIKKSGVVIIQCNADNWANFFKSVGIVVANISVKDINKEQDEK